MAKIRLTKEFRFEMAHALPNYNGLCRNIHGHSYILFVTVVGEPVANKAHPNSGMVMDFGDLKKIVDQEITNQLDHALVISEDTPNIEELKKSKISNRLVLVSYPPTCENMLVDFAKKIQLRLPKEIKLHSLKLNETATSFAEWHASDNES